MQTASIQATGEAMPAVTRRSFLHSTAAAGAAAVVATGTPAVAAQAIPDEKSSAINALLADYLAEQRRYRVLSDEYTQVEARLPAWANYGPCEMNADGSKGGGSVGWPEMAVLPTPDPEQPRAKYPIRPSVLEALRKARETVYDGPLVVHHDDGKMTLMNPKPATGEKRRAARLRGYQKVREVIARVRQQREEKARLGLPRLEAEMEASCERSGDIETHIRELASGFSAAEIAAVAMFEFMHETDDFAFSLLKRTAPHLSGLLRVVVLDIIAAGPEGVYQSMIYQGGMPTEAGA